MRLFVAIPLPLAVTDELTRTMARLRRRDDGLRWSSPESWHITLQFLGNTTRDPMSVSSHASARFTSRPYLFNSTRWDASSAPASSS